MNLFKPESFENVSLNLDAETTVNEKKVKAKDIFCEHWENGEKALQLAESMVKNPIVKLIVQCCIFLGNGIFKRTCKND